MGATLCPALANEESEVIHNAVNVDIPVCATGLFRLPFRLPDEKTPLDKPVFRRRLRNVIHYLMYFAARLTRHAHRWGLSLWRSNPWQSV